MDSTVHIFLIFCVLVMVEGEKQSNCSKGFYRKTTENGVETCNACATCPPGTEVKANCTNQSDTVCRSCDLGTFSSGGIKCLNCSLCPPGNHVTEYCSSTSDTRCVPCEKDTYSSDWSILNHCKQCSRCSRLRTVLKNCSSTQNFECGECIKGYFSHPNLPTCMKCSYCYPNTSNVTFPVPECTTQSDDPNMRCMPVPGPARERPLMFAGVNNNGVPSTTIALSDDFVAISSTQYPSEHVLIPPHLAIPIIIVGASSVVLVLTLITIYKMRYKCGKVLKRKNLYSSRHPESYIETVSMNGRSRPTMARSGYFENTSSDEENPEKKTIKVSIDVKNVEESDVDFDIQKPEVLSPLTRRTVLERSTEEERICSCYAENEGFEEEEGEGNLSKSVNSANEDAYQGSVIITGSRNTFTQTDANGRSNDFVSLVCNERGKPTHPGGCVESQTSGTEALLPKPTSKTKNRITITIRNSKRPNYEANTIFYVRGGNGFGRQVGKERGKTKDAGMPEDDSHVPPYHGREGSLLICGESEIDSVAALESSVENKH